MKTSSNKRRIVAISLCSSGFGYAVLEGQGVLVDYGNKGAKQPKNENGLAAAKKILTYNQPGVLVLHDMLAEGARRAPRIKQLAEDIASLAKRMNIKVVKISGRKVRRIFLGDETATKYELAKFVAERFPDDLAHRLPARRKAWESEDRRMNIFDAMALGIAYQMGTKRV